MRNLVAAIALAVVASGCATWNNARPLQPGGKRVSASLLGPIVMLGDAPLPLPMAVIEGRSGITRVADKPLDVSLGLNATALVFGIVQGHIAASWLLLEPGGMVPSVAVSNRLYLAANPFGGQDKRVQDTGWWFADELEVNAAWDVGAHLVYASISQTTDFGAPSLLLTPAIGAQFDPGDTAGIQLQLEAKWWAANRTKNVQAVRWWSARGGFGVTLGVGYAF